MELKKETIDKIIKYVTSVPKKVIQNLDVKTNKFRYSEIKENRKVTEYKDEELVRMFLITKLINELGYPADRIEIEKEYDAGRPLTIKSRIDIIVRDKNGDAFLFVEVKSPSEYTRIDKSEVIEKQLFNLAALEKAQKKKVKYLMLYTIDEETLEDECIIIDYEKNNTFIEWEKIRNYINNIPSRYGKAQKVPYIKGSSKDLKVKFSREYLISLQKELHNVLWGGGEQMIMKFFLHL
mgnify:CR=1 FL=1